MTRASNLGGSRPLSRARCRICRAFSKPRKTGTAPKGWEKHVDPPGCGSVTYTCAACLAPIELPEVMVEALEEAYLSTVDRFDARNEFRVALRAALAAAPADFLHRLAQPGATDAL